jgi:RPA family protein
MSLCYFAGEFRIRERLARDDTVAAGNEGSTAGACVGRAALNPALRRAACPFADIFAETPKDILVCGVLTEIKRNNRGIVLSARVADPTGVFLLNFGNDRVDCARVISGMEIPSFVCVYGEVVGFGGSDGGRKAALFKDRAAGILKIDGCDCMIHPYSVSPSTKENRVRWVLRTADETAERTESMLAGAERLSDAGRKAAAEICAMAKSAVIAVSLMPSATGEDGAVGSEGSGVDGAGIAGDSSSEENADDLILSIIEENSTKKGILRDDFYNICKERNIPREKADESINRLLEDGSLYLPKGGYIKIL